MSTEEAINEIDSEAAAAAAEGIPDADAPSKAAEGDGGEPKPNSEDDKNKNDTNNNDSNNRDRGHWDQTSQKVIVRNVLKYIRHKELAKLTAQWLKGHEDKIQILRAKKPPKDSWVKVTLAEESMVEPFIELINKGGEGGEAMLNTRGKPMFAKRADAFDDGGDNRGGDNRKRKERDNDANGRDGKRSKQDKRMERASNDRPPIRILSNEEVRDAITPLWRMSYEEQLESKARDMSMKCAAKIVKEIKGKFRILEREAKRGQRKGCVKLYEWMHQKNSIAVEPPLPSPLKYEYRNKCEFTVGYRLVAPSDEGKEPVDNDAMKVDDVKDEDTKQGGVKDESNGAGDETVAKDEDTKVKVEETNDSNVNDSTTAAVKAEETANKSITENSGAAGETVVKDEEMKKEETDVKVEGNDDAVKDADRKEGENKIKVEKRESSTNGSTTAAATSTNFTKIPASGFLAQGWSGGVYPPHTLQNMPDWSCGLCDIFNEFLLTSSMPPYDSKVHRGVWRTVTLRASLRTRECMVIVQHAPPQGGVGALEDGSDDYSKVFESEKEKLLEMLTKGAIPAPERNYPEDHDDDGEHKKREAEKDGLRVTSVFFQEFAGVSHPGPDHPVQHVFGKKSLEEKLGKCTFQISPGAFFQTNTEGAEVLYNIVVDRIKEVTKDPEKTLLLDVCCGTGTIGLTCLKEGVVGKLVGVDISEPAIKDAEINATKNGYTEEATTHFIASPAEKILPETMKDLPRDSPVVAVVDPARDGLHNAVIKALRANEGIQRLVYVSCNPTATLVRDAGMLCSPPTKKYPGRPFKPTISQPVDMFPLTKHCEMVMTFDRMSEEEFEKSKA